MYKNKADLQFAIMQAGDQAAAAAMLRAPLRCGIWPMPPPPPG